MAASTLVSVARSLLRRLKDEEQNSSWYGDCCRTFISIFEEYADDGSEAADANHQEKLLQFISNLELILSAVSPNGNLPTSAYRPLSRKTQAVFNEQGGEGVLSGTAAAFVESSEESFVKSDDESLATETAGMSCTSSPDKIVVETVDDDEESINQGEPGGQRPRSGDPRRSTGRGHCCLRGG